MAARAKPLEIEARGAIPSPAQLLSWIDETAVSTGDKRWSHAAAIIRGAKSGRRPIDDHASLVEMAFLIETGEANSPEEAARLVAAALSARQSRESATKRLARKYRRKFADETN